jgi:hypothetical protein
MKFPLYFDYLRTRMRPFGECSITTPWMLVVMAALLVHVNETMQDLYDMEHGLDSIAPEAVRGPRSLGEAAFVRRGRATNGSDWRRDGCQPAKKRGTLMKRSACGKLLRKWSYHAHIEMANITSISAG